MTENKRKQDEIVDGKTRFGIKDKEKMINLMESGKILPNTMGRNIKESRDPDLEIFQKFSEDVLNSHLRTIRKEAIFHKLMGAPGMKVSKFLKIKAIYFS